MTKKGDIFKSQKSATTSAEPKKKLSSKEKDEAFRLLNENFSKAMDLYFAAIDKEEAQRKNQEAGDR
ncbi:hypothetical protein IAD21_02101 [Abditibacteriota bacterium]|nr:hypothetical protein IAD21_02101 [Abditibacteriota bacterium]